MVRLIGILVGLFFTGWLLVSFAVGAYSAATEPAVPTAEHEFHKHPKALHLASDGPFGKFDIEQLQRGYKVYKEVCSACHSLRHVAFRDLQQLVDDAIRRQRLRFARQVRLPLREPRILLRANPRRASLWGQIYFFLQKIDLSPFCSFRK